MTTRKCYKTEQHNLLWIKIGKIVNERIKKKRNGEHSKERWKKKYSFASLFV